MINEEEFIDYRIYEMTWDEVWQSFVVDGVVYVPGHGNVLVRGWPAIPDRYDFQWSRFGIVVVMDIDVREPDHYRYTYSKTPMCFLIEETLMILAREEKAMRKRRVV